MAKKIIILIVVILILVAGGILWWQNQEDVRDLNKNLPEGVRVMKSLFGDEYRVVNKIDGYEFRVPKEWGGVKEIGYTPERETKGFRGTNITIEGLKGEARLMGVSYFKEEDSFNLKDWGENFFENFGFIGDLTSETVGNFEILKTQENVHLGGMYIYFFKKDFKIFVFTGGSEEFIREIILSGKW